MSGPSIPGPARQAKNAVSLYAGNGVLRPENPAHLLSSPLAPPCFRFSAAAPSVDTLSIVTLSWTGRHLRLVPTGSTFVSLQSESQRGVQQFGQDVRDFINEREIPILPVRLGPSTGPNPVSIGTVRMATVLQSLPIPCPELHTQRVLGWLGRHNLLLPRPQPGYRQKKRELQAKAIETAAYGMGVILEACRTEVSRQQLAQLCAQVFHAE